MRYTIGYKILWRAKFLLGEVRSTANLVRSGAVTYKEVFRLFVPRWFMKLRSNSLAAKEAYKRWSAYELKKAFDFPEKALIAYEVEGIRLFVPQSFECAELLKFNYDEIFVRRIYENERVQILPDDVVVDAGACEGLFSIYALRKGCRRVHAFEPNPVMAKALQETYRLYHFEDKAFVHQVGLSDKEALEKFLVNEQIPGCSTFSEAVASHWDEPTKRHVDQVQVTSLDRLYERGILERVDFIKADVEGFERNLLHGAETVIKKFKPKLAITHYHLLDDFHTLVGIIRSLNSKYKLDANEDVLFAWDDHR